MLYAFLSEICRGDATGKHTWLRTRVLGVRIPPPVPYTSVMKLVYIGDLKSPGQKLMRVRIPPLVPY